jgi:probable rRNA maturation factor
MNTKITIKNTQDKIKIKFKHRCIIKKVVKQTLTEQNFNKKSIVSVTITDNENIKNINKEFRNIDKATDVLSFPVVEFVNGEMDDNSGDYYQDKLILGDIVISAEKALEQSKEYGHSFEREVGFLVCHSVLHLLGYDHEEESERKVMREHEEKVLDLLRLTR